MSVLDWQVGNQDVIRFRNGEIPQGLSIGNPLMDDYIRFKRGQMNIIVGRPNIGKTYWILWYFMVLWRKHNLKFDVFLAENKTWSAKVDLVQLYHCKKINELSEKEIHEALNHLSEGFNFIDNLKAYTMDDILKVLSTTNSDASLIDPLNSLEKPFGVNEHQYDYQKAGEVRRWCEQNKKTMFINMHFNSEALRQKHKDGDMKGFPCPIHSSYVEGGAKWINRADDVYNLHRYTSHPDFWMNTTVAVEKVKDTKTGGKPTLHEIPIIFQMQYGSYFNLGSQNPLKETLTPIDALIDNDIPF